MKTKEDKKFKCLECGYTADSKVGLGVHQGHKHRNQKEGSKEPVQGNQWVDDPRQLRFWSYYTDPDNDTFSNVYQSALKAGYSEEYARVLPSRNPKWLSEKVNELQSEHLTEKAKEDIAETLTMKTKTTYTVQVGTDEYKEFERNDPQLLRIQLEASKFVLSKLAKDWSKQRDNSDGIKKEVERLREKIKGYINNKKPD
jgi:hypothetical protein